MDQQKLQLFLDLTETLNYTETAERNYMTQGNVSKKISALEKELQVPLVDRSNRQIQLTEEGRLLLPKIKRIVQDYQALAETLTEYREKKERVLTVYTIPTMPNYRGFELLTTFLKQHPEIHLNLQESEATALGDFEIEKNTIYFFRSLKEQVGKNFIRTEKDRFVAVMPKSHPLAEKVTIPLAELEEEIFLLLGLPASPYYSVEELCHEADFTPEINYQGTRIDLILRMIEEGLGISLIMEKSLGSSLSKELVVRKIEPTKESFLNFYLSEAADAPAPKEFFKFLQSNYSKME
ncbi:LysR family transcriptional regulator [Enterococcus pseudoavium]|uniref:LysR family transcriptional regulator n=1 Tax=Enterococcus pseudoavium TaxID=44007 RepID=A0ABU3FF22_9ENTE|nr:LysR family transcriptional regulator [Enterococcus pseudoavium]MDT2754490.1 LysR family transcriptional regulator [Enterococcus pseudoavium]MDT2769454.1 LysR family transcriptional regulator [Enterococcus pseudoavium]